MRGRDRSLPCAAVRPPAPRPPPTQPPPPAPSPPPLTRTPVAPHRRTQPFAGQTLSMAALTVATLTLPSLPGNGVHDLLTNTVFLAGFWAWGIAQCLKVGGGRACPRRHQLACSLPQWASAGVHGRVGPRRVLPPSRTARAPCSRHADPCLPLQIFTKRIKKGVWDVRAIIDSGGMPSSHSALCAVGAPAPRGRRGSPACPAAAARWPRAASTSALGAPAPGRRGARGPGSAPAHLPLWRSIALPLPLTTTCRAAAAQVALAAYQAQVSDTRTPACRAAGHHHSHRHAAWHGQHHLCAGSGAQLNRHVRRSRRPAACWCVPRRSCPADAAWLRPRPADRPARTLAAQCSTALPPPCRTKRVCWRAPPCTWGTCSSTRAEDPHAPAHPPA